MMMMMTQSRPRYLREASLKPADALLLPPPASLHQGRFLVLSLGDDACEGEGERPCAAVDVVNPESLETEASFPVPGAGWGDGVYMEACPVEGAAEGSPVGYFLVSDAAMDRMFVWDTAKLLAGDADFEVATLPTGERPVHSYGVPHAGEFWTHPDGAGTFDVVKLEQWDDLHAPAIRAHVEAPGHGKLLWDDDLWPFGYVTNVAEPVVLEVDLETKEVVRRIDLVNNATGEPLCGGTHGIAYSRINGHVYATCSAVSDGDHVHGGHADGHSDELEPAGLIELDPTGDDLVLVQKHTECPGGQVYEDAAEDWVVCGDTYGDQIVFLKPGEPGLNSSPEFAVKGSPGHCALAEVDEDQESCPGLPAAKPTFHVKDDGTTNVFFANTAPADASAGVGWINTAALGAQDSLNHVPGGGHAYKYRPVKAGGGYVAASTDSPTHGIMLLDGETAAPLGLVETNANVRRIYYVPPSPTGAYCGMGM